MVHISKRNLNKSYAYTLLEMGNSTSVENELNNINNIMETNIIVVLTDDV